MAAQGTGAQMAGENKSSIDIGISAATMGELREEFQRDGEESCRGLLVSLPRSCPSRMLVPAVDFGYARRLLHQWAGAGSTVGLPKVTAKAREAESLLGRPFAEISARLREVLEELLEEFRRPVEAGAEPEVPVPPEVVKERSAKPAPVVLVCEDDATMRGVIRTALERNGIICRLADNGRTAFAMVRNQPPNAVILDVDVPEMNGFQVLRSLRNLWSTRELPILMVTGRHAEGDIFRGINLGADAYIVKPFEPAELVGRLRSLLPATA